MKLLLEKAVADAAAAEKAAMEEAMAEAVEAEKAAATVAPVPKKWERARALGTRARTAVSTGQTARVHASAHARCLSRAGAVGIRVELPGLGIEHESARLLRPSSATLRVPA